MKPNLLFVSHVIPLNVSSGQKQRVLNMLLASKRYFRVIFLTYARSDKADKVKEEMAGIVDDCIVIPEANDPLPRLWHGFRSVLYGFRTGLKVSNYQINEVNLTYEKIRDHLGENEIDLVIYEYWHAWKSVQLFNERKIPTFLDMHDILSSAYKGQLEQKRWLPKYLKGRFLKQYTAEEFRAWSRFDGIISINQLELEAVRKVVKTENLLFCPMGVDLEQWKYSYSPEKPTRFGFYGGLGGKVNQRQALYSYHDIMPIIWKEIPDAEFWFIGSKPSEAIKKIPLSDARVKVTGYVEDISSVLSSMTAIFCPWEGIFGFRSRIIELMALGVPVISSPDGVAGMGLTLGEGILIADTTEAFAKLATQLANDIKYAFEQSRAARKAVEVDFSLETTYGKLFQELYSWLKNNKEAY